MPFLFREEDFTEAGAEARHKGCLCALGFVVCMLLAVIISLITGAGRVVKK
jgi:hypothetical protein